jgi:hypothetical protein
MAKFSVRVWLGAVVCLSVLAGSPALQANDVSYDLLVRYILETVRAYRIAYVHNVIEQLQDGGVTPKENWHDDPHAVPLPAQFLKLGAAEIASFEIGLIGLTPIYEKNLPKTAAEAAALSQLSRDQKVITFAEGKQFKGVAADFAFVQRCVDCHNHHPRSPRHDFKKHDLMGAIIVRINRP